MGDIDLLGNGKNMALIQALLSAAGANTDTLAGSMWYEHPDYGYNYYFYFSIQNCTALHFVARCGSVALLQLCLQYSSPAAAALPCETGEGRAVSLRDLASASPDNVRDKIVAFVQSLAGDWTCRSHALFSSLTNILLGTLFLGLQRLEETGVLPLAHQAMLEDMLEGWTGRDDSCLTESP